MRHYYVYIMTNRSGMFYVGVTNDLARRVYEHKTRSTGFTARSNMTRLVHCEYMADIPDAISREKQLKPWRREKKLVLIRRMNPQLLDLSTDFGA